MINRDVKKFQGHIDSFSEEVSDWPSVEVTSDSIIKKINEAQNKRDENNKKRVELGAISTNFEIVKNEIKELEDDLNELKKKIDAKKVKLLEYSKIGKELAAEVKKLKDPDIEKLQEQLNKVEEHNKKVAEKKNYNDTKRELKKVKQESEDLTKQINEIDSEKEKLISNAKFPIKGLTFDEYGINFNNVPLKQCSKSQQLKVALAIGMSKKPTLRIVRILDGALITKKNMDVISKMAEAKDFQVWMEVATDDKIGIHITDGEVDSIS
jgi:predicted  nucleic acid-binding Zn-ribbon protein